MNVETLIFIVFVIILFIIIIILYIFFGNSDDNDDEDTDIDQESESEIERPKKKVNIGRRKNKSNKRKPSKDKKRRNKYSSDESTSEDESSRSRSRKNQPRDNDNGNRNINNGRGKRVIKRRNVKSDIELEDTDKLIDDKLIDNNNIQLNDSKDSDLDDSDSDEGIFIDESNNVIDNGKKNNNQIEIINSMEIYNDNQQSNDINNIMTDLLYMAGQNIYNYAVDQLDLTSNEKHIFDVIMKSMTNTYENDNEFINNEDLTEVFSKFMKEQYDEYKMKDEEVLYESFVNYYENSSVIIEEIDNDDLNQLEIMDKSVKEDNIVNIPNNINNKLINDSEDHENKSNINDIKIKTIINEKIDYPVINTKDTDKKKIKGLDIMVKKMELKNKLDKKYNIDNGNLDFIKDPINSNTNINKTSKRSKSNKHSKFEESSISNEFIKLQRNPINIAKPIVIPNLEHNTTYEQEKKSKDLNDNGVKLLNFEGVKWKNQAETKRVFEMIFSKPFPSCNPDFLYREDSGVCLELDGYNEELNIAFEYNGDYHYTYPHPFNKDERKFYRRIELDKWKIEKCKEKDLNLITIPYHVTNIETYVKAKLKEKGLYPKRKMVKI